MKSMTKEKNISEFVHIVLLFESQSASSQQPFHSKHLRRCFCFMLNCQFPSYWQL